MEGQGGNQHRDGTKEVLTEEEYIERQGKPALEAEPHPSSCEEHHRSARLSPYKSTVFARSADGQKAADMMTAALEGVTR